MVKKLKVISKGYCFLNEGFFGAIGAGKETEARFVIEKREGGVWRGKVGGRDADDICLEWVFW